MIQLERRSLTKGFIMGFKFRQHYLEKNAGYLITLGKRTVICINVLSEKLDCSG